MSGFSAQWLALREPHDLRARNAQVLDAVAAAFADRPAVAVVDLACGAGANLRAIGPRLPRQQSWRLVDNDLGLLARTAALAQPPRLAVQARAVDLARDLELALDGPLDLITCSALLDLVSAPWLERLAVEAAARALPVYAALSYDGRATLAPSDPFDAEMVAAVNRHQRRDKGFGPALGPQAAALAVAQFEAVGYGVVQGRSDWVFGPAGRRPRASSATCRSIGSRLGSRAGASSLRTAAPASRSVTSTCSRPRPEGADRSGRNPPAIPRPERGRGSVPAAHAPRARSAAA
jgi:hypothetical protein